jgi:hypothetical protein
MVAARALLPKAQWYAIYVARGMKRFCYESDLTLLLLLLLLFLLLLLLHLLHHHHHLLLLLLLLLLRLFLNSLDRCDYDLAMLDIISDPGNAFIVNDTKILPQIVTRVVNDICNALPGEPRCTSAPTAAPTPPTKAPTPPTAAPVDDRDCATPCNKAIDLFLGTFFVV